MYQTNNFKQIDYLVANGVEPEYQLFGYSFFRRGPRLKELLDRYYIMYACIPNKVGMA